MASSGTAIPALRALVADARAPEQSRHSAAAALVACGGEIDDLLIAAERVLRLGKDYERDAATIAAGCRETRNINACRP